MFARRLRFGFFVLLGVASLAACKRPSGAASPGHLADTYPADLDRAAYAGSEKCAGCHATEYAAWLASPHGRAVLPASPKTVLGDFAAKPLGVDGGSIAFARDGDRYFMEVRSDGQSTRHAVDLVLGSGRQHQDYLTRDTDPVTGAATWRMLPAIWVTPGGPWLPASLYQPAAVRPASPSWWRGRSLVDLGCVNCHVSQGGYRMGAHGPEPTWTETPVNCESCHGPAAAHVAAKSSGRSGGTLRDMKNLGHVEEARLCGVCHGDRHGHRAGKDAEGWPWFVAATLRDTGLRPDATQTTTSYQYSGHVASACYRGSGLLCSSCHAPHSARPRALDGEPADGDHADRQCTACHRNFLDDAAARPHGHHAKSLRCIDCHMAPTWIGDSPERHQRTADHSIAIPRPEESAAFRTPNACTTCHADKDAAWALTALQGWGATKALGVRDWVRAVALGRRRSPDAPAALVAVLADTKSGPYLDASALDLLEAQLPDARLVPAIEPWTRDPDPWLRALAFRALLHHDRDHRGEDWDRAMADPHPLVRETLLPAAPDPTRLSRARFEQDLADQLDWCQRPQFMDLIHDARGFAQVGERQRALDVLDLAERAATPHERTVAGFPALRESIVRPPAAKASP